MKRSLPIKLTDSQYLSDRYDEVIQLIYKEKRLVINANPGIGKTRLFIELGKEIQSGKRNGRLIFCAPYLVIQSQFNTALKKEGYEADLILNASEKRKKLDPNDKIVISTYPGLKHIIHELNEDDIIVMDESHTLAYSYATGDNRAYYDQTVEHLYNSNANIVLLSGTPNQEINDLLDLTPLEVSKNGHPKSEVSIYHSFASPLQISLAFAEKAIQVYGDNSLNVIYIKDRNTCEQIREALEDKKYNSKVITSYHKKQDHYKALVEYSEVSKKIQFLICTNVISTGTNVENTNIGMALMIGEHNPDEIKQFSKRFRDKLDIKVDIVINPLQKPFLSIDGDLEDALKNVENDLSVIREQLLSIKASNLPESYPNSYESGKEGSKSHLISELLKRYTQQTAYLRDLRAEKFRHLKKLSSALGSHQDVDSRLRTDKFDHDPTTPVIEERYKMELDDIRNDFADNYETYSPQILLGEVVDYYNRLRYDDSAKSQVNRALTSDQKDVTSSLKNPYFEKEILVPATELNPFVGDFIKSIHLSSLSARKLNKLKISLWINELSQENLRFKTIKILGTTEISKKTPNYFTMEQSLIMDMVLETLEYCHDRDNIVITELADKLMAKFGKRLLKIDRTEFPFDKLLDKTGKFSSEYLRAFLDGIIYSKPGTNKKVQPDGKTMRAVIFNPDFPEEKDLYNEHFAKDHKNIMCARQVQLLSETMVFSKKPKPAQIILSNKHLIMHYYLQSI